MTGRGRPGRSGTHADPPRRARRRFRRHVSGPFLPPSARPPPTSKRPCARSSPTSSRAATRARRAHAQVRPRRPRRASACGSRAAEIDAALRRLRPPRRSTRSTLARDRIEAYHRRQQPADDRFTDALGVELGIRWTAIEAVGLYVPGGTAAYPSSVLMNAVPAKVAGVPRLVMVVPAPDGKLDAAGARGRASSPASTRSIASAARRRWRRSPTAPRRSRRSPRSSGPATPMWRPPSAWCSARSAST